MPGSKNGDINELVRSLEHEGYLVYMQGGHFAVQRFEGDRKVFLPQTPSDYRGLKNACSKLRKAGFVFTYKGKRYER